MRGRVPVISQTIIYVQSALGYTASLYAAASPIGTAEMERKGAGFARSLSRLIGEAVLPLPL
jgi:hypothetical protein